MWGAALMWIGCQVATAGTGTIAVVADVTGGPLSDAAIQSAVWHELRTSKGHDPLLIGVHEDVKARMAQAHVATLLTVDVRWEPEAMWIDGGLLGDEVPTVKVVEWRLREGQLDPVQSWTGVSNLALAPDTAPGSWLILPEVALQRAVSRSLRDAPEPLWSSGRTEPLALPLQVCVDPSWKQAHGADWQRAAEARLERADALLRQADLALKVVDWCEWSPARHTPKLATLLADLATQPLADGRLRLGLTAHPGLTVRSGQVDDVGRAYTPGRDAVVVDQRAAVAHDADWDVADEGVAIAHELLHALGVPHNDHPQFVMSAVQRGNVHVLAPSTQQLARTAALARYRHWDPIAAAQALSGAADAHLTDPALAMDYISENLVRGPGVPQPHQLREHRMSALGHAAVARHWSAQQTPTSAQVTACGPGPATEHCAE